VVQGEEGAGCGATRKGGGPGESTTSSNACKELLKKTPPDHGTRRKRALRKKGVLRKRNLKKPGEKKEKRTHLNTQHIFKIRKKKVLGKGKTQKGENGWGPYGGKRGFVGDSVLLEGQPEEQKKGEEGGQTGGTRSRWHKGRYINLKRDGNSRRRN